MADDLQCVAIVPARGGSKRLPRKNVRPFFGHPMMAYGITAALHSGLFSKVMVSSDDEEVEQVARWYGADFVQRPTHLATDGAKSIDAVTHALGEFSKRGTDATFVCQVLPNCPLVLSSDIIEHWKMFQQADRSFQISVVAYRCVYPEWAIVRDSEGKGSWRFGPEFLVRSQELSASLCPSGSVWWARCSALLAQNTFYGSPFHVAQIDANRGVDIDDEEDLQLAELLVHGLTARDGRSPLEPIDKMSFMKRRSV